MSAKLAGLLILLLALVLPSCSGGSPSAPPSPPAPTYTLNAEVFYDENANGLADSNEAIRLRGVRVVAGSGSGVTAAAGRALVTGVLGGTQSVVAETASLPPAFVAGAPVAVTVPATADVFLAVTLPIGESNGPNRYMAFGDSITVGRDGSDDGQGYRRKLEDRLAAFWGGEPDVENRGVDASRTTAGLARIQFAQDREHPAYTLIHYGTNDWNDSDCRTPDDCFTIDNLRGIVEIVRGNQSIPVLATIIPVNVGFDARVPPSRQDWVAATDVLIRALATEQGAILADMEKTFLADPDLSSLFADHIHPNDKGYGLMADVWFRAITTSRTPAATASVPLARALFSPPGGTARGR